MIESQIYCIYRISFFSSLLWFLFFIHHTQKKKNEDNFNTNGYLIHEFFFDYFIYLSEKKNENNYREYWS